MDEKTIKKIGIGLIGLGNFGEAHASVYFRLPTCCLVSVCSRNEERAKEIASKYNAQEYQTDYRKLLKNPEVDAIVITASSSRHTEITLAAIEAGKDVLVEKPMSRTIEETDKMIEEARKKRRILMVGHLLRFDPRVVIIKQKIESGELGKIVYIYARRNVARHIFEYHKDYPLLLVSAIHDIDIILWYMKDRVKKVFGVKQHNLDKEKADTYAGVLVFENGGTAVVECSWLIPDRAPSELNAVMEIIGTKGTAQIAMGSLPLSIWSDKATEYPDIIMWPNVYGSCVGALKEELIYFIECVRERKEPELVPLKDSREAQRVALAICEASEEEDIITM